MNFNLNNNVNNFRLLSLALLTGFFGDAALQVLVKNQVGDWGLKDYFQQHGSAESLFIAAGMMAIFYLVLIIVLNVFKIKMTWLNIAIYAVIIDLIFRKTRLFTSLDGYYSSLNYFWSAVWAIIPMLIPFMLNKLW